MKNMLVALSCVGIFVVSCGSKDEKGSSGGAPNAEKPGLDLVGAGDFKNTAKNGKEVSAKFQEIGNSAGAVKFSLNHPSQRSAPYTMPSDTPKNILNVDTVRSFLGGRNGEEQTRTPSKKRASFNLQSNSDCASSLEFLDNTFTETSKSLVTIADQLDKVDGSKLQDGVVRNPANDQFAVSFTIDLSKIKTDDATQNQSQRFNMSGAKTTGVAQLGAGANDKMAVLSMGIDAAATEDTTAGTLKGGFVVAADNVQKLIRLAANANASMTGQDDQGHAQNVHGNFNTDLRLQAGANPSIGFTFNGSGNLASDANGETTLTDTDHSYSADFKIEKLANNDVAVTYKTVHDGKTEGSKVTLTNDANGQCVVKDSTSTPSVKTAL